MTHELQIILVVFGEEPFALARGLFGDLKSYVDAQYVGEAEQDEYGSGYTESIRRRRMARETTFAQQYNTVAFPRPAAARPNAAHAEAKETFDEALCMPGAEASTHDLETILKGAESTFTEHLLDLLNERCEKDSNVYRRAEISRQLFHKIVTNRQYQPTKSTAIQLALGLRLNLAETQKLLEKAGYALTRSSKADLVVQYFIERGEYSIVTVNMALFDCGLPLLKTGSVL